VSEPSDEEPSLPSADGTDVSPSEERPNDDAKIAVEGKREQILTDQNGLDEFINSLMP